MKPSRKVNEMAYKKKARSRKSKSVMRRSKDNDMKFQLYLDSTYGLSKTELFNTARSYGTSKRKSRSMVSKIFNRR